MPGDTFKKLCLYKNCGAKNCTLFRFPKEPERFAIWVENSGLEIKGNVDLNKPRFLCDKHFSNNYISFQSRRKMLVHTAVPMHHNGAHNLIPSLQSNSFKIVEVGESSPRSTIKPDKLETEDAIKSINGNNNKIPTVRIPAMRPKTNRQSILVKRESNRIVRRATEDLTQQEPDAITITLNKEDQDPLNSAKLLFENDEENISLEADDLDEFLPCTKRSLEDSSSTNDSPAKKRKVKIVYVQKKRPEAMKEADIDVVKNDEKTKVCLEDDVKSSSEKPKILNKSEAEELKPMIQPGVPTSNRSEFIFNGEMYVQMSKRNYEAEKTKLHKEIDYYKALLRKLKYQVMSINID